MLKFETLVSSQEQNSIVAGHRYKDEWTSTKALMPAFCARTRCSSASLSTICLKPLRIAFDHIGLKKPYEQAIRFAHEFGLTELSNYMLYNFHDSPA